MNKLIIASVLTAIVIAAAYLAYAATRPQPAPAPATQAISIYAYRERADRDLNNGQVGCSADAVLPLARAIPRTNTPIQDAINLLLRGELTPAERAAGYSTEFPNSKFKLEGADLAGDVLTLQFTDVPGFTDGGSCRVGLLWAQIEKTAAQFLGVRAVRFQPETLFQP